MFRSLILTAGLLVGTSAFATTVNLMHVVHNATIKMMKAKPNARFTVGDTANYDLSISSFKGTMVMKVTALDKSGLTITQDVDLGSLGKSNVVEVINPQTGEVISVTVNGEKQNPPDPNDMEITSSDIGEATVPAGTFMCQDIKFHIKSQNSDGEQWVDMSDVPVGGMVKMTTTEQGLPVEADLTSFQKY